MMTEAKACQVREDLQGRIAAIAQGAARLSQRQLVEDIDGIRSTAHNHGFATVSCLAGRLESALSRNIGGPTLLCYLDALHDAVKLEPMRAASQQALMASIALRIGA